MPTITLTGIAPTSSVGTGGDPVVVTKDGADISPLLPTAVASTNAFGTATVTNGQLLQPTGIASTAAFGTAKVTRSSPSTIAVDAIQLWANPRIIIASDVDQNSDMIASGADTTGAFVVSMRSTGYQTPSADLSADSFKRSLMKTNITMPTPAIIKGRPVMPAAWLKHDSAMSLPVGVSDISTITPPVPVVNHPSGPSFNTQYTWTVEDLADPPGDHGFYSISSWKEHSGGPTWKSAGVYTPRVADKVVYGAENVYHTYSRSVHFDASSVEHMWIDLGTHTQPFTWVICGMINYYPQRTYGHYLLDAGKPTPQRDVDRDWTLSEGLSYRSLMLYQASSAVMATHIGKDAVASGRHIKAPHDEIARPRVFMGVFNGSSSWIGSYDRYHSYGKSGRIDSHSHRYFVLGRRQNHVSDNLASHMTLFEIRFFNQALTSAQRSAQYKQLASKWSFNKYGRGT